jgi:hypothetical protein
VSDQFDKEEIAHLEKVNAELTQSLARCRAILKDCREHLAANSNEAPEAGEAEEARAESLEEGRKQSRP